MEQFLKTLFSLSLAGTALALLLMLSGRVLRGRVSSRFVYLAWLLVLLRFILPAPGLLSVPSAAPIVHAPVEMTAPGNGEELPGRSYRDGMNPSPGGMAAPEPQAVYTAGETIADAAGGEEETPLPTVAEQTAAIPVWTVLFWIWAAGAAGAAGWNLTAYFRYRRSLYRTLRPVQEREALCLNAMHPRPWPVLQRSGAVGTPLLMGLLRPVIILPDRAYTPEMLEGILRHELTHYRRGDLTMKWFAAAVFCVHWFNPVVYLLRGELDRICELSCDERLLRDMDAHEKQVYGELLLTLAADRPLPRRVVATSFATEKRNLKERLIQIMTFKKKGWAAFTVMMVVLALLVGCAVAMGPAAVRDEREEMLAARVQEEGGDRNSPDSPVLAGKPEGSAAGGEAEYYVDSVDAFLAALGSDRTLVLAAGEYNLTQAANYGGPGTDTYAWDEVGDGYELVLDRLERLTILGEDGAESVSIVTEPRYANVLHFEDCRAVTIGGLTAGHTPEQGTCSGGVLDFNGCDDTYIDGCVLYGCGTVGIIAKNCRVVIAEQTTIKECSYGAIWASNSYDIRFMNGWIHDCGLKSPCFDLIQSNENTGFVVYNTEIYDNDAMLFLSSSYSVGVELRGCRVYGNQFNEGMRISGRGVLIEECALNDNALVTGLWYVDPEHPAVHRHGEPLSAEDLMAMNWTAYQGVYEGPAVAELPEPPFVTGEDGRREYHVTTADEFLAAIGSDRTIYLDAERFDLSAAENYGGYGGKYYYWQDNFDGSGLVISGVMNLNIIGMGRDKTTVQTMPRWADVLSFLDCYAVTVQGLTAGHTPEAGACSGDVISFQDCGYCMILDCGLFGCGVNGINAYGCQKLTIRNTEIYECSGYGAVIHDCYDTVFEGCSIHDCAHDMVWVGGDGAATWDGERLKQ